MMRWSISAKCLGRSTLVWGIGETSQLTSWSIKKALCMWESLMFGGAGQFTCITLQREFMGKATTTIIM